MATKQQFDNSGILFKNDRKDEDHPTDRDYAGDATIGGVQYWMSAWIKQGQKGKFMTFSFKRKDAPKTTAANKTLAEEMDEEIPF
jgi:hypothetical protein